MKENKITDFKEYHHQYYLKNKEMLSNKGKIRVICTNCNRELSQFQLPRHMKTKLCLKNSKQTEPI